MKEETCLSLEIQVIIHKQKKHSDIDDSIHVSKKKANSQIFWQKGEQPIRPVETTYEALNKLLKYLAWQEFYCKRDVSCNNLANVPGMSDALFDLFGMMDGRALHRISAIKGLSTY